MKWISWVLTFLFLLLPSYWVYETSIEQAQQMVESHWTSSLKEGDQAEIYFTYKEALNGQVPFGIKNGWVAVGYLSLLGFWYKISSVLWGANLDSSFIYNNIAYSMLAAFLSVLIMFKVAKDQSLHPNPLKIAIGCALFWFALFRLSGILRFSWIPWSHYASAFMALAFVGAVYQFLRTKSISWSVPLGFFGTLFLFSRRHEFMAVAVGLIATLIVIIVGAFVRKVRFSFHRTHIISLLGIIVGVGLSLWFITYFSNGMPINSHYAQQRELNSYVNEYLKVYPQMIPLRIVQTFIDPNFFSFGNSYQIRPIFNSVFGMEDFPMPMIFQLPILWFLVPFAFVSISIFGSKTEIWKKPLPPALLMLLMGAFSFCVLVCGYLATAVWGGSHLRNGLVREFIVATLLLAIASGPALALLWAQEFKIKSLTWIIPVAGVLVLALLWGQIILTKTRILEMESMHLDPHVTSNFKCKNGKCIVEMDFRKQSGAAAELPFDHMIVSFYCREGIDGNPLAKGEAGVTRRGQKINFDLIKCPSPVQVDVYPLALGYCGSGHSTVRFEACPKRALSPTCREKENTL